MNLKLYPMVLSKDINNYIFFPNFSIGLLLLCIINRYSHKRMFTKSTLFNRNVTILREKLDKKILILYYYLYVLNWHLGQQLPGAAPSNPLSFTAAHRHVTYLTDSQFQISV